MAETSSSSGSSSSSSSGQTIPNYPERDILQNIAGIAASYAQSLMGWAQQTYAQTSQVTDQNIGRYLDAANMAGGMASNMIDRYQNIFQPLEDQLVKDANTYASSSRISDEMGRSEAQVGQDMDAARQNAEQDLRSYGIDPSAGRYASLDMVARTQEGAAKAAAGTAARLNTENTGRALRGQAIQVGQQYPGQTVNALNQQASDVAGAQNAVMANANLGGALMGLPNNYLGTAMSLKNPMAITGPSSSQSRQQSQGNKPDPQQPQQPQGGGGAPKGPVAPGTAGVSAGKGLVGDWSQDWRQINDPGQDTGPDIDYSQFNQGYTPSTDWSNGAIPDSYSATDQGYTPSTDWGSSNVNLPDTSFDTPWDTSNFGSGTTNDWPTPPPPADDTQSDTDWSSDFGEAYAKGGVIGAGQGAIPDQPVNGHVVPAVASPSRGRVSDDVTAKVKVGEMVVPDDVVRWKGEEYFQKLIMQSRKARMGAPAKGKPASQPPGQVGFQSAG